LFPVFKIIPVLHSLLWLHSVILNVRCVIPVGFIHKYVHCFLFKAKQEACQYRNHQICSPICIQRCCHTYLQSVTTFHCYCQVTCTLKNLSTHCQLCQLNSITHYFGSKFIQDFLPSSESNHLEKDWQVVSGKSSNFISALLQEEFL